MTKKIKIGWIILGTNMLVSVGIPIVIGNSFHSLILAFLTFIALSCLELLVYHNILYQTKRKEDALWEINDESDMYLNNIKLFAHKINEEINSTDDLFYFYIQKKMRDLQDLAKDAATNREIKIDGAMLATTEKMYASAFNGRDSDIFRPVYLCHEDNDFFFNGQLAKRYFRFAFDGANNNKIREIRRLFVYSNDIELSNVNLQRLIQFHQNNSKYNCKKISKSTYDRIKSDCNLEELKQSFGVYGEMYLYTERLADRNKIVGFYSKDKAKIGKYIDFFDKCWDSADEFSLMPITQNITIDINYVFNT